MSNVCFSHARTFRACGRAQKPLLFDTYRESSLWRIFNEYEVTHAGGHGMVSKGNNVDVHHALPATLRQALHDRCRYCCYQLPMGLSDLSGCNSPPPPPPPPTQSSIRLSNHSSNQLQPTRRASHPYHKHVSVTAADTSPRKLNCMYCSVPSSNESVCIQQLRCFQQSCFQRPACVRLAWS
jgi:hypothetical protein